MNPGREALGGVTPVDALSVPPPQAQRFYTLPNGLKIACQSPKEADHFFEDIFDHRVYLSHGVTLWDGATVFDVGGNIGLFSVFVHQNWRNVQTITFEPAPPLFDLLHFNISSHGGKNGGTCKLFRCGVSDDFKTARFTFYPYSSGMSSFYGDVEEEKDVLRRVLENQKNAGLTEAEDFANNPEDFLDARFTQQQFECSLIPLSSIIRSERIEAIDLIKIDVQKSELDVLRGLSPEDWRKVRQIAMEVHDLNGQLDEVHALLTQNHFNVVIEQDPLYKDSVMYNLFAVHKHLYRDIAISGQKKNPITRSSHRTSKAFSRLRRQRKSR